MTIEINFTKNLDEINDLGSAITWEGLVTDQESLEDMFDWIETHTKVLTKRVYVTSGKLMNELFNLTGEDKYPDDLNIVSVKLQDLEKPEALVTARFAVGGRWMDDIVSNLITDED